MLKLYTQSRGNFLIDNSRVVCYPLTKRVAVVPSSEGPSPVLAKLNTFALVGIDAVLVEAEVDNSPANMPKTVLVGLPEMAVREASTASNRTVQPRLRHSRWPHGHQFGARGFAQGRRSFRPADCTRHAGGHPADSSGTNAGLCNGRRVGPRRSGAAGERLPTMAMAAREKGFKRLLVPIENA